MPGDNLFEEALEESGVTPTNTETQTSDQEQESQTSNEESTSSESTEATTENTSSETQGADSSTEESTEENSENEDSSQGGQSETQSNFVELSNDVEESTSETTESPSSETAININEMFGEGFESVEDVKSQLELVSDLETQLEETENRDPEFANDFVKGMNDWVKNGGDPIYYAKIQGMNVDDLSPEEAIKLDLQQKYSLTEAEAQAHIDSTYKTEDFDDEDGTRIDPKSISMKVDAAEARGRLKKNQVDNTLVEQKPNGMSEEDWNAQLDEIAAEQQEVDNIRMWDEKTGWAPEVSNVVDEIKEKGLTLDLGNGMGWNYAYTQDEKYTEDLISQVDQSLYDSGLSREDNPKLAREIAENIYWLDNKADILKKYGEEIRSMKDEEYHKLNNNPSAIQKGDPIPSERSTPSVEKQVEKLWEQ
jgi:hypothetical protein